LNADDGEMSRYIRLPPEGISLEAAELSLVQQAIRRCNGNRTRAAVLLGITRDQLRYCLKKHEADLSS
jgi:DNA-binding protein Fis